MSYETILYEKRLRIAHITLNRPRILNAYNDTMGDELLQAHRFDQDDALQCSSSQALDGPFALGPTSNSGSCVLEEMKRIGGPAGGIKPAGGLLGIGQR